MEAINEAPSFLDYREKSTFLYFAKDTKELRVGDVVVDRYNTYGFVKFISDNKGAFVRFIDGREVYQTESKEPFKKVTSANINQFNYQEKYYSHITKMGFGMMKALKKYLPHVNMFNDGNSIRVRASTYKQITDHFTQVQLGDNHSFISIKLTPQFNVEVEEFLVKRSDRGKDRFAYNLLDHLFRTIDNTVPQANRFKYKVTSSLDTYNKLYWFRMEHQWKKFQIKFTGFHAEWQKNKKRKFRDSSITDQNKKSANKFR